MATHPAITPIYSTSVPNEAIELYSGAVEIEQGDKQVQCDGSLHFEWLPSPRVSLYVEESTSTTRPGFASIGLGEAILRLPTSSIPADIFVAGYQANRVESEVVWGSDAELSYVIFHLVNFHELLGEGISGKHSAWLGRATAEVENWRLTIDTVEDFRELEKSIKNQRGYGITHAAKLERLDGGTFSTQQASDLLDNLFWYFSFARGIYSPPILPVGFDTAGNRVWEQWQALKADPWMRELSWFSDRQYVSLNLQSSLSGFLSRWQNPEWRQTLKLSIHYYVGSNTDAAGLEGSIILAQIVLECLAATYFIENGHVSADGFERLPAADAIRLLLLSQFHIPIDIPPSLLELTKLAKAENWTDGPQALTAMRNTFIHVTPKNRDKALKFPFHAQVQLLQLSLSYIELALLNLFGYQGHYVNRARKDLIAGVTEPVPWKSSTS